MLGLEDRHGCDLFDVKGGQTLFSALLEQTYDCRKCGKWEHVSKRKKPVSLVIVRLVLRTWSYVNVITVIHTTLGLNVARNAGDIFVRSVLPTVL